ncbi:MAG: hypothetical protein IJE05_03330 [Clostridia bacterium]|nr:hypothetical protein [Clostridia bacterium]
MKESRRKVDVEQLKKKKRILQKIQDIEVLMLLINVVIVTLWGYNNTRSEIAFFIVYVGSVSIFAILIFYSSILITRLDKQIFKIKIDKMKKTTKEENLKNYLTIKNETIQDKILSNQIKQIIFKNCGEKELKADILLGEGKLISSIAFPKEEILSLINQKEKKFILQSIIDSITIEELENEKVKISIKPKNDTAITNECYYEELLKMFEIKE